MMRERQVLLHCSDEDGDLFDGALKNGSKKEIANKIFDRLAKFESYAFNKSHAAAYSVLTF